MCYARARLVKRDRWTWFWSLVLVGFAVVFAWQIFVVNEPSGGSDATPVEFGDRR